MNEKTLVILDPVLRRGFTSIPNCVLFAPDLSMAAKCLYTILLSFAWQEDECWPGQDRLAGAAGCHVNTVEKYLKELRDYGLISWKRRGLNRPNIYFVHNLADVEKLRFHESKEDACRGKNTGLPGDTGENAAVGGLKALKTADSQGRVNPESQGCVNQESQALVDKEYSVEYNVVVEDNQPQEMPGGCSRESGRDGKAGKVVLALQAAVKKACGAEIPGELLNDLLGKYSEKKIKEKIALMGTGTIEMKNVPGWLVAALKEDYKHVPGRGRDPATVKKRKMPYQPGISKEKELIRSLYLS